MRWVFTILGALSLLLFATTATMWVRSYWTYENLTGDLTGHDRMGTGEYSIGSHYGMISVLFQHLAEPFPFKHSRGITYEHSAPRGDATQSGRFAGFNGIRGADSMIWVDSSGRRLSEGGDRHEKVSRLGTTLDGYIVEFWFPYWSLTTLFTALPAITAFHRLRRRHRTRAGHCPACGYDLRATRGRCPECGAIPVVT